MGKIKQDECMISVNGWPMVGMDLVRQKACFLVLYDSMNRYIRYNIYLGIKIQQEKCSNNA